MGTWIFRGLLAIALLFFLLEGQSYSPHAARLPQMVAGLTLVFVVLDAILSWWKTRNTKETFAPDSSRAASSSFLESPRFYATAFCLIAFFLLFPWLGYMLSSALFVFSLSWMLGERRWYVLLVCSIAVPIVFWYASEAYLKVIMPKGLLFEPFSFL